MIAFVIFRGIQGCDDKYKQNLPGKGTHIKNTCRIYLSIPIWFGPFKFYDAIIGYSNGLDINI